MDNRQADIDLLFRNGLRDLEVLPPTEAWNNIIPVIRKKQQPVILLRTAALVAVLLSISFLTYRLSWQLSTPLQNNVLAVDQESVRLLDNPADPVQVRLMPATDRQPGVVIQNEVPGQPAVDELIDEQNSELSGPNLIPATRFPNLSRNLMIPSGIQAIKGSNYKADNANADYGSLYGPGFEEMKEKYKRWSVTAMASPTYYKRPELSNSDIANQISSSEQSGISYSGGVGFAYKINRKLSIQSGLYYSSIGNEVDNINSFAGFSPFDLSKGDHNFEVLTSSGRIFTENPDVFLSDRSGDRITTKYTNDVFDPAKANLSYINNSLFQNFSYLEMPVIVRYKLVDKSIDFNLIGGLSYNLLVNNSVHAVIDGSKYDIGKTAGLNPFMVSSSLGMGMEYSLSEKFSLNLEPTFRYYLNPFSNGQGIKTHPYSFGVFSGLSYKF